MARYHPLNVKPMKVIVSLLLLVAVLSLSVNRCSAQVDQAASPPSGAPLPAPLPTPQGGPYQGSGGTINIRAPLTDVNLQREGGRLTGLNIDVGPFFKMAMGVNGGPNIDIPFLRGLFSPGRPARR